MRFTTMAALLSSPLLLAACATAQLSELKDVREARGMLIKEPIPIVFGSSAVMMAGAEAGLLPGYYTATKENQNGTFYLGPGQCVWYKGKDSYSVVTGGIWLPKNSENPARLFSIVGTSASKAEHFDAARSLCRENIPQNQNVATPADLTTVLAGNPQALGIKPNGPNNTLTGGQAVGGAIGLGIAQALADSAKGEYQIWQKVEDAAALQKIDEAVRRAAESQARQAQ